MVGRGQLKIADFEYAKKMTEPRAEVHDIRTVGSVDDLLNDIAQELSGHGGLYVHRGSLPGVYIYRADPWIC